MKWIENQFSLSAQCLCLGRQTGCRLAMLLSAVCCALLSWCILASGAESGPNLLPAGGFEQGPWHEEEDIQPAQVDLMVSHSGLQSGRLTARPDAERFVYGPAFDVAPAKTYVLVAWIRCLGVSNPKGVHLRVLQWNDKKPVGWIWNWTLGQGVNQLIQTGGTYGWTRFAALMTKLDPKARRAVPYFAIAAGSGTAWLDDVEVREWNGAELSPHLAKSYVDPADKIVRSEDAPPTGPGVLSESGLKRLSFEPRQVAGPSILGNGGFEQPLPADWARTVSLDCNVKHGGKASLSLAVADGGCIAVAPGVNPDLDYRLGAWVKTQGVPPKGLTLRLWPGWWNEAEMSENLIVADGTLDWTRYEIVLTNLPESLRGKTWSLYYALKGAEHGQPATRAWVDDVELVPLADSIRVTSPKSGHFFVEGEQAKFTFTIRRIPPGEKRRLRWATTDLWGRSLDRRDFQLAPGADGTAQVTVPLSGRGYFGSTLVLSDAASNPLQGAFVSAAILPRPAADANTLCPESIFACWGANAELAPLLGVKWTRWTERGVHFDPVEGKPDQFTWNLKQHSGDYRPREACLQERQAGMMRYLCFHRFADWMLKGPNGKPRPVPQDWARFADWVAFIYGQVADLVPVVEVWNEPIIPWGWEGCRWQKSHRG